MVILSTCVHDRPRTSSRVCVCSCVRMVMFLPFSLCAILSLPTAIAEEKGRGARREERVKLTPEVPRRRSCMHSCCGVSRLCTYFHVVFTRLHPSQHSSPCLALFCSSPAFDVVAHIHYGRADDRFSAACYASEAPNQGPTRAIISMHTALYGFRAVDRNNV